MRAAWGGLEVGLMWRDSSKGKGEQIARNSRKRAD